MFKKFLSTAFALTVIVITLMYANMASSQIVKEGWVSYWTFNEADIEDKTVKDVFGENHGTIHGDPKQVEGKLGEALKFDGGDDCVEIQNPSNLDMTDAITVTMWLKVPDDNIRAFALSKNDNLNGFRFEVKPDLFWTLEKGDVQKNIKSSLPREEWCYLVGTFDGKESILYINGEQVGASLPAEGGLGNAEKSLIIGAHRFSGDLPFNGTIDDVAIYKRALSEDEVQQNFEAESWAEQAVVASTKKLAETWGKIKNSLK